VSRTAGLAVVAPVVVLAAAAAAAVAVAVAVAKFTHISTILFPVKASNIPVDTSGIE
jgi:hypothetical protein